MSSYELIFIRNIPFLSKSDGQLYYYDAVSVANAREPVHIGTYDKEHDSFALFDNWKERVEPLRNHWLDSLVAGERGAETPRAPKPRRIAGKAAAPKAKNPRGPKGGRNVVCTSTA
jgi:hypothetical protein